MSTSEHVGLGLAARVRSVPRWYLWAGLVAALGAAGGASYWLREPVSDAYLSGQETVLRALGLAVLPVAIWLIAFVWAVARRRSWLRRANLWAGALALVAVVAGSLAFHQPEGGVLGFFTLDGELALGGELGRLVAGTSPWLGALRVAGVFLVASWLAFPGQSTGVAVALGRALVFVYVMLVVAGKATASALRRMYRFDAEPTVDARRPAAGVSTRPRRPPEASLSSSAGAHRSSVEARSPTPNQQEAPPFVESTLTAPRVASIDMDGDAERAGRDEPPTLDDVSEALHAEKPRPAVGKFNRFWQSSESGPGTRNGSSHVPIPDEDDADDEAEPILDAAAEPWALPSRDLLVRAAEGEIAEQEMSDTAETIRRTLGEYGVEVEIGQVRPGPAVTMYGLIPGWVRRYKQVKELDESGQPKLDESGRPITTREETKTRVKVDSIFSREKDLALALKTPSIRIETPVMGESQVGIEVPNPSSALVALRNLMESDEFQRLRAKAKLPIALGKASGGETVVVDLAKMPHLLIAGATGAGKSVFINTIVSCLIMEKSPAEMRLLLVDPKRVELTPYNGIPHLLTPVVVETDKVVGLLKGLIQEMFNRYRRMEEVGVRNIDGYNKKMPEKMPLLVLAIDELADLMMSASFDVEQSLCRLAQLGRATGIHLIVATQRPSVDVVTGLIKANFPTRVSFGVTSQIDSRTILDAVGAEKLLGRGDMLYLAQDASRPERVQGVFISDKEIEDIVAFWQTTHWRPLPRVQLRVSDTVGSPEEDGAGDDGTESRDELIPKAMELAQHHSKLSTSLLQRRLRIGYPRAARLMDQLEEEGIVGPGDGSKSRDVIIGRT